MYRQFYRWRCPGSHIDFRHTTRRDQIDLLSPPAQPHLTYNEDYITPEKLLHYNGLDDVHVPKPLLGYDRPPMLKFSEFRKKNDIVTLMPKICFCNNYLS